MYIILPQLHIPRVYVRVMYVYMALDKYYGNA